LFLVKEMKVLIVSQSQELSQGISSILKVRWPDMTSIHTSEARESLELAHTEEPDVVMYHLPEPGEGAPPSDHFEFIGQVRGFSDVPLIVISQSNDVTDKVAALEMGADDWVSPFSIPMEFIAKVNAILRRCSINDHQVSSFLNGKLSINLATREVRILGHPVKLTPIQYKLLCHLIKNQGRVCTNVELLRHVWGPGYSDDKELLKLGVYRLRSKIEEDPSNPEIIFNERGVGYVIRASGATK
jgi:two-component system KDP operon response regulator KdpE